MVGLLTKKVCARCDTNRLSYHEAHCRAFGEEFTGNAVHDECT
jgi:hypothetical protein